MKVIEISNLLKFYSGKKVLDLPNLSLNQGSFVALTGNNGAGKTTLFRSILDLILPDEGQVKINGQNVRDDDTWKENVAAYLDESFLIGYLRVEEYFHFIGGLKMLSRMEIDERINGFSIFFNNEILGQKKYIRDFSKGNKMKIGIVSCLLQEPSILILDEPYSHLDPSSRIMLNAILKYYNKNFNTTIFLSSHDITHVMEISQRILLMESGGIIREMENSEESLLLLRSYFNGEGSINDTYNQF
ncbi:ABC transporter ATP-binding protein [Dyadobacter sp. 3J3]|uniref:ABC transporter ATP-binding protein n=1 Tax=Dyadobacter sp. 3J3 TaxID=2606600 RepID=UPI00135876DF|nr:ABC transporter ATP-binding protein [Dyadobacter sp. 3J3]